jgi:hypothetical protein
MSVDTPSGPVQVDLLAGSSTERRLRLRGHGMPQSHGTPGDLYAEVKIVTSAQPTDVRTRRLFLRSSPSSRGSIPPDTGILSGAVPDMTGPGPPSWRTRTVMCSRAAVRTSLAPMRGRLRRRADPPLYPVSRHDGHGLTMTLTC